MPINFLALETSCDETSVAVFNDRLVVLANVVSSQEQWHSRFQGVVPEIAARAHMELLGLAMEKALTQAKLQLSDIGAIAVHYGPGLAGCLLVGLSAAKALALALGVPLIAVNHVHSHLFAARMTAAKEVFPAVGLVVSGGHTLLFDCESPTKMIRLGGTIDDAAGEAFDKIASLLGLGFPGGPAVEKEARGGDPRAFKFPRSFAHESRLDFSFSGLKTAVRYTLAGPGEETPLPPEPGKLRADIAASFQLAVIDILVLKCLQAVEKMGRKKLIAGGGVLANRELRSRLESAAREKGIELFLPTSSLCTDNAAMAALAVEYWKAGEFSPLDLEIQPTVF
ncbi:MAG: tRNA (adenosine(37)-N6)-threonylcarbamoyltransferase complex transferase subunit TsaD [Gemmataceae bacterium]|nr:tRNA (adenosine(37)-N6)-threonylcarbamoyltransferase complex transferase subunit TsaD [Gemmataceae bacterium]